MQALRFFRLAAITVALIVFVMEQRAAAVEICPMYLVKSCVSEHGVRHTSWTNACLARRDGLHYLHRGAC
jgi:hypothetical protein